jgi:hypothetical protein
VCALLKTCNQLKGCDTALSKTHLHKTSNARHEPLPKAEA